MKKLSIITICYNEPDLEKTCRSIVNQTWQDFEWIVIDGGSNEETLAIFDKYKYRIDKFVSEPDNGIYNACNKGIKLAESEYVQLLNAGDSYYDTKVLEDVFKEQNSLLICSSSSTLVAIPITPDKRTFFKSFHPPVSSISLHSSKEKPNFVSSWAICICNKQGMTRWTLEACLLTSTNNLYESMACIIAT